MKTVAVGMSGGVDSSVAALLLKRGGYDVIGLSMRIYGGQLDADAKAAGPARHSCFGPDEEEEISQARDVADRIGIPHRVVDLRAEYEATVLVNFSSEYAAGRTPNPCVLCNAAVKFGFLVDKARESGISFDLFATGHYARTARDEATGLTRLLRAEDPAKDQSYFLYRLNQDQLRTVLFPLGSLKKSEVRVLAREAGFGAEADRRESQNFACGDYGALIAEPVAPGDFVDETGKRLGTHRGLPYYTIGQRRGLGISISEKPLYVIRIDARRNRIVLGDEEKAYGFSLTAGNVRWTSVPPFVAPTRVEAKIRSQSKSAPASAEPISESSIRLRFDKAQFAITPGQSVVLYLGETVAGGGIIEGE